MLLTFPPVCATMAIGQMVWLRYSTGCAWQCDTKRLLSAHCRSFWIPVPAPPFPSHTISYHTIPYHTRLYPPPLQAAAHLLHRRSLTLPSLTSADGNTTLASPPLVRDLEAKERVAAVSLAVPISNPDPLNPAHSVFQVESAAGGALSSVPGRCSPITPPTPATPCSPATPYSHHTYTVHTP